MTDSQEFANPHLYPQPGQIYKHFKGNHYKVVCLAASSEDVRSSFVVYHPVDDPKRCWVRPLHDWVSRTHADAPNPRFQYVCEGETNAPNLK